MLERSPANLRGLTSQQFKSKDFEVSQELLVNTTERLEKLESDAGRQ